MAMKILKDLIKPALNPESAFLFKGLVILMIIDSISTIVLLRFGCGVESNPTTAWFHKNFGVIYGQVINAVVADIPLFALIAGIFGYWHGRVHEKHKKIVRAFSCGVLISYGYIIAGNLWLIFKCF